MGDPPRQGSCWPAGLLPSERRFRVGRVLRCCAEFWGSTPASPDPVGAPSLDVTLTPASSAPLPHTVLSDQLRGRLAFPVWRPAQRPRPHCPQRHSQLPRAGGGDQPLSEKRGGETSVWPVDPAGCSLARARSRLQTRAQAHPAPGNWLTAAGVKGHRRGRSRRGQKQGRGHTCCLRFCARGHEAD